MLHEDEAGDAITGLQQKTHYGQPQCSQIFESIPKAHPKYVTINSHIVCYYKYLAMYTFVTGPVKINHVSAKNC